MDDARKRPGPTTSAAPTDNDDFLLREGFDLIAGFRAIRSEDARKAIIKMIAAVVQAENDARKEPYG